MTGPAMSTVSKPIRQMLAVAILVGVLWAFFQLVVLPISVVFSAQSQDYRAHIQAISRGEHLAASRDRMDVRLTQLEQTLFGERLVYHDADIAQAQIKFQQDINQAARQSGTSLENTVRLEPMEENEIVQLRLRVQLTGDISVFDRLIRSLAERRPILFLEQMDIRSGSAVRDHGQQNNPRLTIAMTISAFYAMNTSGKR